MKTLDEVIQDEERFYNHCKDLLELPTSEETKARHKMYTDRHKQFADWLKELKWWRSCQHACETCKYCTKSISDEPCASCMEPPVRRDNWECGYESGETE